MAGRSRFLAACVGLCWAVTASGAQDAPKPADVEFFEARVRPVLVEHCYSCHSDAAENLRGGLKLDSKAAWQQGGDSGPSITPGDPDDSLLIQAIRYDDPLMKMPPKGKMPAEAIEALEEWVRRGAPDPRTGAVAPKKAERIIDLEAARKAWPFTPLASVEVPKPADEAWCRNDVDRFLRASQESKQITPSKEADRRTLIRRATFDLTGLPPTPEEVAAFEADSDDKAYEHLIDRLLESPRYGERWARHWLDLARYAESHGFEHDYDRPTAYTYRDFVIKALNQDLPYDTFVKWQLAGDELSPDDPMAQMATGFLGAGVHSTQITAATVEKERYDELDDILNTTGTAFLGLTVGCARCHDHKFDPIPTTDYYRLLSTFTTTVRSEVDLTLDPAGDAAAKAKFDADHAPFVKALADFEEKELSSRLDSWEASGASGDWPWTVVDLTKTVSRGGATFETQKDGSALATGATPDHDTYEFEASFDGNDPIRWVRLEAMADPSMTGGGPGRASNGNFALSNFEVTAVPKQGPGEPRKLDLTEPRATYEQSGLPVAAAIDGDGTSAWAVDPQFGKDHAAAFRVANPTAFDGGATLKFRLTFANNLKHAIGRPRLSVSTEDATVGLDAASRPQAVARTLSTPKGERTEDQRSSLLAWYRTVDPEWKALKEAEKAHAATAPKPSVVKAMICTEGLPAIRLHTQGADFLEKTHFLRRGDPNQKGDEATQGFLQVLMSGPENRWAQRPPEGWRTSYRRASLAAWMTDTDEGAGALAARVAVNRLWQHHFGRGLVATPSDFGAQGEPPSDPRLLDWLASELIRGGWKLKPIHRLLMTSAAYRQSGRDSEPNRLADPDNATVWHMPPRRLEAEAIRDTMLSVSGLLDESMYGPGTMDERMKRRSIYFGQKRSKLIPMMTLFDAPDGTVPIAVRGSTTVAPQSLYLMNSPIAREWAQGLAARVKGGPGEGIAEAVGRAYRLAFQRPATEEEIAAARRFVEGQEASYQGIDGASDLALADFCQVLLSLNELVFVE